MTSAEETQRDLTITAPSIPSTTGRQRLGSRLPSDRVMSWVWALGVTAVAFVLRMIGLAYPKQFIFDEVYYAKDAYSLLQYGVELNEKSDGPGFVAHPPLGKWCIALGEWLFGYNSLGWRVPAVIAGTLSVLIVVRVGRRLFGSTLLGCVAGLLLALDGLHFVSSRVALLDIFLMLFVIATFACLVIDRDARRRELLAHVDNGNDLTFGAPGRTLRTVPWWRLAAGVFMGAALGVKWSALWFLLAFVVLMMAWEMTARRAAGVRRWLLDTIAGELGWLAAFVGIVVLTYLATWTGWFLTDSGWDRHWAENNAGTVPFVPDALVNLWHYQWAVYQFHSTLTTDHPYESSPWSWLFLARPVAYYYTDKGSCGAEACSAEIIALGTPLLWWSFIPALIAGVWRWLARRDWRAFALLLIVAVGMLPWTFYPDRTMFFFYTLPILPFLVLLVTLILGSVLGNSSGTRERRLGGAMLVGGYVLVIGLTFAYFYPIYTGQVITYAQWHARMWLETWI